MGLLHCQASRLYTMWPPAWTGFHELYHVILIGPPAQSGFPFTLQKDFGIDRHPCVCRSIQRASRIFGLPSYTLYGLRHGPASIYLITYWSPGLLFMINNRVRHVEGVVRVAPPDFPERECQQRPCRRCDASAGGYQFKWYSRYWAEFYNERRRPGSWEAPEPRGEPTASSSLRFWRGPDVD